MARSIIPNNLPLGLEFAVTPVALDLPDDNATPSYNTDQVDQININALQIAITSMTSGMLGSPIDGQKLIVRILDDSNGPYAIAWGAAFADRGATLPVITVTGKVMYVGLDYNANKATWDCIAAVTEA